MIKCFEHQTYPKDRIEWIIVDDGTDKIEDMVTHIPQVKYFKFDEKLTLGQKRNISNDNATGEIIIYMDDDDYYPPDRISHAVDTLKKNPKALCAGSSTMYIHFKHINQMLQFGPYGPNHATAATFAFRKELLKQTRFDETSSVAEEKKFLKDYTIPFVQLNPNKSILVFSHNHNSFDKKELLKQPENNFMKISTKTIDEFIKNDSIKDFFINNIDDILSIYQPGKVENKPEVLKQIQEIKENKNQMIQQQMIQHLQQMDSFNRNTEKLLNEHKQLIQILLKDNSEMKKRISKIEEKEREEEKDREE
jgi:glycosyltransferase involved in cell wall biosynthesis